MTPTQLETLTARAGHAVQVSDAAATRLAGFIALRARWGKVHNVSGPAALADPWGTDVLDGLMVWACLAAGAPLADVGAGSGVPGLVVAAADPDRAIHLIEPRVKRAALLRSAAGHLGLSQVQVHRQRWPIALPTAVQVVSRAVVSPSTWPALAAEAPGGASDIVRMLADDRPAFTVPGYSLAAAIDYTSADRALRVERWHRA